MRLLCTLALLCFLTACKKTEHQKDSITIELDACRDLEVNQDAIAICYEGIVEDSRCPANVHCVWQGVAKARFTVHINTQQHIMHLSTAELAPHYSTDTTISGHQFRLLNLQPAPGTSGNAFAELEIQ